jgi:hypothetical protein
MRGRASSGVIPVVEPGMAGRAMEFFFMVGLLAVAGVAMLLHGYRRRRSSEAPKTERSDSRRTPNERAQLMMAAGIVLILMAALMLANVGLGALQQAAQSRQHTSEVRSGDTGANLKPLLGLP